MRRVTHFERAEARHRRKAAQAKPGSLSARWHRWAASECRRRKHEELARLMIGGRPGWVATLPVKGEEDSRL